VNTTVRVHVTDGTSHLLPQLHYRTVKFWLATMNTCYSINTCHRTIVQHCTVSL